MKQRIQSSFVQAVLHFVCIVGVVCLCSSVTAQTKIDLKFVEHLINRGNYKEAIFEIDAYPTAAGLSAQDSLNYFKGWANYSLKNLEESTQSLLKVSDSSPLHSKSAFFAGYNQAFLGNYKQSEAIFSQLTSKGEPLLSLANFEQSGIEFLKGNWTKGEEMLSLVDLQIASINQQVEALKQISSDAKNHRRKSAFWAGAMSSVIPGSGKIYAGKTGEGIASLIGTTGFGLITWENYHKSGIKDAKTLIFGCLFMATYVSNIYGSVVSVKISENYFASTVHNQILFQLHIPLRNFFE
jgi:hypothetical protein